jgi:hypothetical protein
MKHSVTAYRSAGLEARWTKTAMGQPMIVVRNPKAHLKHQRDGWWYVDAGMYSTMRRVGVLEGFDRHTMLGDVFSLSR